jgi:dTDP-4-dehydrorhamnose reductase
VRVLILGGDGMLGHQVERELRTRHHVGVTLRRSDEITRIPGASPKAGSAEGDAPSGDERVFSGVDVREIDRVAEVMAAFQPQAVVNAVGIVKQRPEAEDPLSALEVNAAFPHRLARLCADAGARLVHFSTDCVFSGRKGAYRETDSPDPVDTYGRTKLLGEVGPPHVTLRTSIVGLEKGRRQGLVEWFLASRGRVHGYRRALYSGLTTLEMARLVDRLLVAHPDLAGLFHVASAPIDKFTLLSRLASVLGRKDVQIEPVDEPVCDRSLCADAFMSATGYRPPGWDEMLRELAREVLRREEET